MTAAATDRNRQPDLTVGAWLYALTEASVAVRAVDDVLHCTAHGRWAVVYRSIDATLLDDLADEDGLCEVARHHDMVIRWLAHLGPVLPIRLGTVCADVDRLVAGLHGNDNPIVAALEAVRGCSEWTVRIDVATDPADTVAEPASDSGTAYLMARREKLRRRTDRAAVAAELDRQVRALARDVREGASSTRLARAYLVPNEVSARLVPMLADAAARLRTTGAELTVDGPLPPYSFADVHLEVP